MYLFRREENEVSRFVPSQQINRPSEDHKKQMAIAAISGESITKIAKRFGVSRKCVYAQKRRALEAIELEFEEKSKSQEKVLFTVSFTNDLIAQLVLAMFLCGKSSYVLSIHTKNSL
ncbi:MAG: helix-turn-helix domain-containing protein [Oligoflexus sp.]